MSTECKQADDGNWDGAAAAETSAAGMQRKSSADVISRTSVQRVQWNYEQPAARWAHTHMHTACQLIVETNVDGLQ